MTNAARFRRAYAQHRAAEGRHDDQLLDLPYAHAGPWASQWQVRARTFERFMETLVRPRARAARRALHVLDLGAGNGWLSYRLSLEGHHPIAVDWRADEVDGLGAAGGYADRLPNMFHRIAASFDAVPLRSVRFDLVVFNAAIHYSTNLDATLAEASRLTGKGGAVAILDSPFYRRAADGERMVASKREAMRRDLGERSDDLLSLDSIEFLTPDRLAAASSRLGLRWRRHRVRYPLWYELRAIKARLRGLRAPSRFDLWEATVSP